LSAVAGHSFLLNDREQGISWNPGAVLLDVLRDGLGLTGTKDGCREGDCGACMVLLGTPGAEGIVYRTVNSCLIPVGELAGRHVVTIEGLKQRKLSPVQQALVHEGAIQCGFCTPGLVIALTGFLLSGIPLSEAEGIAALGGNICRCTGYVSIRRAITRLCGRFPGLATGGGETSSERISALVARGVLPRYFLGISSRLHDLLEASEARSPEGNGHEHRSPVLVGGGTDLFVTQADRLRDENLTFLSRREDLRGIRIEGGECCIGAATSLSEIEASPVVRRMLPDLGRHFARIASLPIRNRATVAGNIVNASPSGDLSVIFLALNARAVLAQGKQERRVLLRNLFRGYKILDMAADELITEIRFVIPGPSMRFHFEKVGRRPHLDIAGASSAINLKVAREHVVDAHVSAGSVAPVPLYLRKTSEFLHGQPVSPATALAASAIASREIKPISDVRGSDEYRRALLSRLILAHFLTLFPEQIREEDLG
jgi:xanthine dehydrogenase small subunit